MAMKIYTRTGDDGEVIAESANQDEDNYSFHVEENTFEIGSTCYLAIENLSKFRPATTQELMDRGVIPNSINFILEEP